MIVVPVLGSHNWRNGQAMIQAGTEMTHATQDTGDDAHPSSNTVPSERLAYVKWFSEFTSPESDHRCTN